MSLSRREVVVRAGAGLLLVGTGAGAQDASRASPATAPAATAPSTKRARPPAIEPDRVRAFVGAAHGNITGVREMLAEHPTLVNATWDWGGGDFETALGGASHMGRYDIAGVLLEAGARLDLFAAAMLGYLPVVKAALEISPEMLQTPGPHGIPLIAHAERGGEAAKDVLAYLRSLGG